MRTPTMNEYGEYIDCAFHVEMSYNKNKCKALINWYNDKNSMTERCKDCPFFKTKKQLIKEDPVMWESVFKDVI